MGLGRHQKVEGGQGGKRGHSNMAHWITTEEIKKSTRHIRRIQAKQTIARELAGLESCPKRPSLK
jgi:hypothetical protein